MHHALLIAIGGAGGALCRYWLVNFIGSFHRGPFPVGTLAVNLIGSFVIGIMYVLITERLTLHPDWRNVATVGFLGAFTTFSTFSLETVALLENGQLATAALYTVGSVAVCLLATWLAISVTRLV